MSKACSARNTTINVPNLFNNKTEEQKPSVYDELAS